MSLYSNIHAEKVLSSLTWNSWISDAGLKLRFQIRKLSSNLVYKMPASKTQHNHRFFSEQNSSYFHGKSEHNIFIYLPILTLLCMSLMPVDWIHRSHVSRTICHTWLTNPDKLFLTMWWLCVLFWVLTKSKYAKISVIF